MNKRLILLIMLDDYFDIVNCWIYDFSICNEEESIKLNDKYFRKQKSLRNLYDKISIE